MRATPPPEVPVDDPSHHQPLTADLVAFLNARLLEEVQA